MKIQTFKPGTVVVFDPAHFCPSWGEGYSEKEKQRAYGSLGYGKPKKELFVYLADILDSDGDTSGHCVLVSLSDQHIETMRHTCDFRAATVDEF